MLAPCLIKNYKKLIAGQMIQQTSDLIVVKFDLIVIKAITFPV